MIGSCVASSEASIIFALFNSLRILVNNVSRIIHKYLLLVAHFGRSVSPALNAIWFVVIDNERRVTTLAVVKRTYKAGIGRQQLFANVNGLLAHLVIGTSVWSHADLGGTHVALAYLLQRSLAALILIGSE